MVKTRASAVASPQTLAPLAAAALLLCSSGAQAVEVTFVSGNGSDANTSTNCAVTAPCRNLQAALTRTNTGGEIVVLNSGAYAPVTITRSVAITAPQGVYAGIMTSAAPAVRISGSGLNVALKGLHLFTGNAPIGIDVSSATGTSNTLRIENCVVDGFATGLMVAGPWTVQAHASTFSNSVNGIDYTATSADYGIVSVERVSFVNAATGVLLFAFATGSSLVGQVVDSTYVFGPGTSFPTGPAFYSEAANGPTALYVDRTDISGASNGLLAYTEGAGTAYGSLTNSRVSNCGFGLLAYSIASSPGFGTEIVAAANNTFVACSSGVSNQGGRITLKNNLITQMSIGGIMTTGGTIEIDGNTISQSPVGVELSPGATLGPTAFSSAGNNVFSGNTTDLGAGVTITPAAVH